MSRLRALTLQHNSLHVDRFLTIVEWAKRRYSITDADGHLSYCTMIKGKISRFTKIEDMAAAYYMDCRERHADVSLRDCPAFPDLTVIQQGA